MAVDLGNLSFFVGLAVEGLDVFPRDGVSGAREGGRVSPESLLLLLLLLERDTMVSSKRARSGYSHSGNLAVKNGGLIKRTSCQMAHKSRRDLVSGRVTRQKSVVLFFGGQRTGF